MPLYKGNTKIGAIYKGTTPISAIYKGNTLIFSSYTWQEWYVEYVYNTLVPTTINSKNVLDKAKVSTIYGNSVVENQLVQNGNFASTSGWSTSRFNFSTNNNIGTLTISDFTSGTAQFYKYINTQAHTYLVLLKVKTNINVESGKIDYRTLGSRQETSFVANQWKTITSIITTNADTKEIGLYISANTFASADNLEIQVKEWQIIDITQMFPFNTPTTLTDNRVQALLNRGYISYNTGTLKNVDMSEISSEPYNVWDEEIELGAFDTVDGHPYTSTNQLRTKNDIELVGGESYTFEITGWSGQNVSVWGCLLDENKNIIAGNSWSGGTGGISNNFHQIVNSNAYPTETFVIPNNAKYLRFYLTGQYGTVYNNDICFHRTGTRTGYVPYQAPQTLSLKYQGSGVNTSRDTMVIDNGNIVFIKNMNRYTFSGSETYTQSYSAYSFGLSGMSSGSNLQKGNLICEKLENLPVNDFLNDTNVNGIGVANSGTIFISTIAYNNRANLTNTSFLYQLATPQVITIPRKHIGVVKIRDLSWTYWTSGTKNRFYAQLQNGKIVSDSTIGNVYSFKYETVSWNTLNAQASDNLMAISTISVGGEIVCAVMIHDSSSTSTTDFVDKYGDYYIYYETTDESTIPNIICIQGGGTITTNSEVLPNIDFEVKAK